MTHMNSYVSGKRKSSQQERLQRMLRLKSGKAAGEDEIRPEMLKALNSEEILWLTRVRQVAWKFGKTLKEW